MLARNIASGTAPIELGWSSHLMKLRISAP